MSRGALMTAVHSAPVYFAQFTVDEMNALMKNREFIKPICLKLIGNHVDVLYVSLEENQGPFQKRLP